MKAAINESSINNSVIMGKLLHSKSSRDRRFAREFCENVKEYSEDLAAAKAAGYKTLIDLRVTVAEKLEKDKSCSIKEQLISKRGELITLVQFGDGSCTQFTGSLDKNYVNWNR
jgi:hypothetical protein